MRHKREEIFRGIPVSPGFARGRAFIYRPYIPEVKEKVLSRDQVRKEIERFRYALKVAEQNLHRLYIKVKQEMGRDFADFINIQLALITDEELRNGTESFIREKLRNAEFAYIQTLKRFAGALQESKSAVFLERFIDVTDVSARVLSILLGDKLPSIHFLGRGSVIVARQLLPSEAALLDSQKVAGVVLEEGGKTSHSAIMAKAKEIPAVFGVDSVLNKVKDGDDIVVDGYRGLAIANPSPSRLKTYETEIRRYKRRRASLIARADEEPVTLDGKMIDLSANVEFLIEAQKAKKKGARGIGLFRTEYMYLAKRRPPTEEEQFEVFREVAVMFKPFPVIIRTFDLGGDKVVAGYTEANPFLGWRAIRVCLDEIGLFRMQLRAILRASAFGNVKVMFPMVSTIEELRRVKLLVNELKQELRREGKRFDESIDLGVMIETPSAALLAHKFAEESRFLSIGSNDLTQYTLAVDRGNQRVARLFNHFHPSVLQLIKRTIDAAHQKGIWVGMCGEFAADPLGIVLLLGMGVDEISVVPGLIPEAKQIIRSIDTATAKGVVEEALGMSTALEVERLLNRELHRRFSRLGRLIFTWKGQVGE